MQAPKFETLAMPRAGRKLVHQGSTQKTKYMSSKQQNSIILHKSKVWSATVIIRRIWSLSSHGEDTTQSAAAGDGDALQ